MFLFREQSLAARLLDGSARGKKSGRGTLRREGGRPKEAQTTGASSISRETIERILFDALARSFASIAGLTIIDELAEFFSAGEERPVVRGGKANDVGRDRIARFEAILLGARRL